MKKDIIVIDNFYENPNLIREYAINELKNNSYGVYPNKKAWITSRFKEWNVCPFKSSESLISKLQKVIGEEIDIDNWKATYPCDADGKSNLPIPELVQKCNSGEIGQKWNCCFHFKNKQGQQLGEGVHTHSTGAYWSNVADDGWAGLIYLNPSAPIDTGLNIWENKLGDNYRRMTDRSEWQLTDKFGALFNRLILIRGSKPHSGADGFGHTIEEGRIFQTLFFRIKKTDSVDSVKIF